MHALVDAGADLIELGVPFSDPMADGPVIQHASERALARGVGLAQILDWVARIPRSAMQTTPIVLMGYLNPVEIHGYAAFRARSASLPASMACCWSIVRSRNRATVAALARCGAAADFSRRADHRRGAPDGAMCARPRGFLYYVSFAGITGADRLSLDAVRARVAAIKAHDAGAGRGRFRRARRGIRRGDRRDSPMRW